MAKTHKSMSNPPEAVRNEAVDKPVIPYFLLVLACIFWAGNVVAGRALSMAGPDQISPAVLNALRWGIALVALAPFVLPRLRAQAPVLRAHAVKLLALGTLGIAGYYLLFYLAVETVPAIEAGLLVGAMPAIIMGLTLALKSERPSSIRLVGLSAALVGSLATVAAHEATRGAANHHFGDFLMIAAVLCWSVYTILLQRWKIPISTLVLTFSTASVGLLVTLLAVACECMAQIATLHLTEKSVLLTVYIGLFPAIGSTLCWNEAVRRLGAGTPGVFLTLIPVFSTGLAAALLGERIDALDILCLALVVGGVALVVRNPARPG
jgi:drug/metabolite transporter (DMT)-like permease